MLGRVDPADHALRGLRLHQRGRPTLRPPSYSHARFDFRNRRDQLRRLFCTNSILTTRAHQAFCLSLGKPYSDDYWGISASDSQHGYTSWGGPGTRGNRPETASEGSTARSCPTPRDRLPAISPWACLQVLHSLKDRYSKYAWGRYGFCDAFHPDAQWYDPDVLGIDPQEFGVLAAENLRTGFVWDTFAKNPEVAICSATRWLSQDPERRTTTASCLLSSLHLVCSRFSASNTRDRVTIIIVAASEHRGRPRAADGAGPNRPRLARVGRPIQLPRGRRSHCSDEIAEPKASSRGIRRANAKSQAECGDQHGQAASSGDQQNGCDAH